MSRCGRRNNKNQNVEYGFAESGEWPFYCHMNRVRFGNDGLTARSYIGSASLIAPGVALTSAARV